MDYVRAVEGSGLGFFEQPVAAEDLAGMAQVAAATDIAIGADEGIHSLDDISAPSRAQGGGGVSLKAIKLGGIGGVVEAARLCDRLDMNVNISCKTGESSVACAAALHAATVIPGLAWGADAHPHGIGRGHHRAPDCDRKTVMCTPSTGPGWASMSMRTGCAATASILPSATPTPRSN